MTDFELNINHKIDFKTASFVVVVSFQYTLKEYGKQNYLFFNYYYFESYNLQ